MSSNSTISAALFVRRGSAPTLRLGFGSDSTVQAHAAELAAKDKLIADAEKARATAEAELARYRVAYDKSPAAAGGRFGLLELE